MANETNRYYQQIRNVREPKPYEIVCLIDITLRYIVADMYFAVITCNCNSKKNFSINAKDGNVWIY